MNVNVICRENGTIFKFNPSSLSCPFCSIVAYFPLKNSECTKLFVGFFHRHRPDELNLKLIYFGFLSLFDAKIKRDQVGNGNLILLFPFN